MCNQTPSIYNVKMFVCLSINDSSIDDFNTNKNKTNELLALAIRRY